MSETLQFENAAEREFWEKCYLVSWSRLPDGARDAHESALKEADWTLAALQARSAKLRELYTKVAALDARLDAKEREMREGWSRAGDALAGLYPEAQQPKPPTPASRFAPGQPCPTDGCAGTLKGATATGAVWCPVCQGPLLGRALDQRIALKDLLPDASPARDVGAGEGNGSQGRGNHG